MKIYHLFPKIDYTKLKYDDVGLYSITNYTEADKISAILKKNFTNCDNINILDGTGGLGGNTISFSKYFNSVVSIELDKERYSMLENNINLYKLNNVQVLNTNSIEYLLNNYNNFDIYFFDPPWGGRNYKEFKKLNLKLDNMSLSNIINILKDKIKNKMFVYKLPFNYDMDEFNGYNYKLYKIRNYILLIINL